jgi:site-specific DNA-methyltransferase (adenine-specific)
MNLTHRVEKVLDGSARCCLASGDCRELLGTLPPQSVDLVIGSPPYGKQRKYGELNWTLKGQAWVDWMFGVIVDCLRVCRGPVVMVMDGSQDHYAWDGLPMLLGADLLRAGITLRKPPAYVKNAFGGAGPDWWRNDWEFCLVATNGGRLPLANPTASGKPPKYKPGGNPSNRGRDDKRAKSRKFKQPAVANPGNVIRCTVGGGHLGHPLAHENEAPFPEALVRPFVQCYSSPDGIVLDPFLGSGTTPAVAAKFGRRSIGFDLRPSQVAIAKERLTDVFRDLAATAAD